MAEKTLREQLSVDIDYVLDWVLREKIPNKANFLDDLAVIFEDKNEKEFVRHNALEVFQLIARDVQMPNMSSLVQRLIQLSQDQKESDGIRANAQAARLACHWDKAPHIEAGPTKIPEGPENLKRRSDWFRRRS